jgi:hypothetical protein
MMKFISVFLFYSLLLYGIVSIASNPAPPGSPGSRERKYPVSEIPAELKTNADRINREYSVNIEVKPLNSMVIKVHKVETVIRASGLDEDFTWVYYNDNSKVGDHHFAIYDAEGIETDHSKSSQILDQSAIPDGSFYSDDRVKSVTYSSLTYPCTLEIDYEISIHKLLFYPTWAPQDAYRTSVENAEFTVVADDELIPRFREANLPESAVITRSKGQTTVSYHLRNAAAINKEIFSIPLGDKIPAVYIAPNEYRTLGENFDLRTWGSLGLWRYSLIKDRDVIPERTKKQLLDRLQGKQNKLEKVREIYKFVQESTRYLNVNIGIGGLQPEEASTVAKTGYGDCKGLVNYTKALMSVAGITSYYTLVNAGAEANDIFPDFPSNQFNHIILCVPSATDTIWLECTNQSQPFGFLGSFTANRHVLLITPEGGVLVKTPAYPASMNVQNRKTIISLDSAGNAAVEVKTSFTGLQYEVAEPRENQSFHDLEKMVMGSIRAPSVKLQKISYTYRKDQAPEAFENMSLSIRSFAPSTGNRLFLPFTLFGTIEVNLNELLTRKTPILLRQSDIDRDTVEFHIPAGMRIESVPEATSVSSCFGTFTTKIIQNDNLITYCREFALNEGRYAPESFQELATFLKAVAHADKSNAVLIKN